MGTECTCSPPGTSPAHSAASRAAGRRGARLGQPRPHSGGPEQGLSALELGFTP